MKSESEFYAKYLSSVQKKKEKIHEKMGYETNSWKFEEMNRERHVLEEIENFIWKKL